MDHLEICPYQNNFPWVFPFCYTRPELHGFWLDKCFGPAPEMRNTRVRHFLNLKKRMDGMKSFLHRNTKHCWSVWGQLTNPNCNTELLMLKYGLMLSVANVRGKKEKTKSLNTDMKMRILHQLCTLVTFIRPTLHASLQMTWNELEKHWAQTSAKQVTPLAPWHWSSDHLSCLSLFLCKVRHVLTCVIGNYPVEIPHTLIFSFPLEFTRRIYILFKIICSFRLLLFWAVWMLVCFCI